MKIYIVIASEFGPIIQKNLGTLIQLDTYFFLHIKHKSYRKMQKKTLKKFLRFLIHDL